MKTKYILSAAGAGLVLVLGAGALIQETGSGDSSPRPAGLKMETTQPGTVEKNSDPQPAAVPAGGSFLQAALNEKDPARRLKLLEQWADALGIDAMEKNLAALASLEDEKVRAEVRGVLLASWAERDLSGMLKWFAQPELPGDLRRQGREILVEEFGRRDPAEMFSWMEQTLPESVRTDLYGPFFRQWAADDPVAAGAKLGRLTEGMKGHSALWDNLIPQVAAEWSKTDMDRALAWLQSLPKGAVQSLAMTQTIQRWAETRPREAAAYAIRQNVPVLYKAVAAKWAETDPENASAWAEGLPAGEARDAALVQVTSVWADSDPEKMADWAKQFPEGPAREQMLGHLLSSWAANDAAGAGAWLQDLPSTRSRDFAVSAFCNVTAGRNPDLSFQWAGKISDPLLRNQRLERAGTVLMEKDPKEARRLIAQSSLPENLKSKLLANP